MASRDQTLTFTTPDISCAHCVATIESSLGDLKGIRSVQASAETKIVTVELDPDHASEQQVREVLEEAGYPAS